MVAGTQQIYGSRREPNVQRQVDPPIQGDILIHQTVNAQADRGQGCPSGVTEVHQVNDGR